MALVNPNIAMSFRQPEFQAPNMLAQYAQLMQLQQSQRQGEVAQMQLEKLRRDKDIFDQFQANVIKYGGPSDPNAIVKAFLDSPDPSHAQIGYEMKQKLLARDQYDAYLKGRGIFPSATGAAAPAAAPAIQGFGTYQEAPAMPGVTTAPVAPRTMPQANALAPITAPTPAVAIDPRAQADVEGIMREIDRLPPAEKQAGSERLMILQNELAKAQARLGQPNALAPVPAPSVNRLTTTTPPPQLSAEEIQREMELLSGMTDPRAKARLDILKPQLAEALRVTTATPGSSLVRGGRVVGQIPPEPTKLQKEFEYYKSTGGTKTIEEFMAPGGQTELQKLGDKAYIERSNKTVEGAEAAQINADKLNRVVTHLRSSDAITGIGAELFNDLNRAKSQFLKDKEAGKKVTDTEYLKTLLGSDVFPMIQSLGIGARGMDTPAERQFMIEVLTGNITLSKDTLLRLTADRFNNEVRAIDKYNKAVKSGELTDYLKAMKMTRGEIPVPALVETKPLSVNQKLQSIFGPKP